MRDVSKLGAATIAEQPHAPQMGETANTWVVDLECREPKDLGLAAELTTISALAQYVAHHAAAGFAPFTRAAQSTV